MMDEDRIRKSRLEMNIVAAFLPLYNHATGASLMIDGRGMPPEPDVLCQDTVTSLFVGIEVVTVYHDDTHAKSVWALAGHCPLLAHPIEETYLALSGDVPISVTGWTSSGRLGSCSYSFGSTRHEDLD